MGGAFAWGALAAASQLHGGGVAHLLPNGRRTHGLVMAFGAGVLISAVAYELVEEAFDTSAGEGGVALGLAVGSLVFFAGDAAIDRYGGADRKSSGGAQAEGNALAIVLGIVLDGLPESVVLGLTVLQGGGVSVAFLAAVFVSNIPEAVAASSGLHTAGWSRARVLGLWGLVTVVCGFAALLGYQAFGSADPRTLAFVLSFAGGAILTMLADTMMPEAFEHGGRLVGLVTTLGFGVAFALSALT
jgi:ZIP family zinc transporter